MTWEGIFRFAYQKDLIPILKALATQAGEEKFIDLLQQTTSELAGKRMATRSIPNRDLATFAGNMRSMPPLYQHALFGEIVEDTARVFEYRVWRCLWAKAFREERAGDIGYAMVCHPDFSVAAAFNPKLKLIRTKTLMQGHECCNPRYVMEG